MKNKLLLALLLIYLGLSALAFSSESSSGIASPIPIPLEEYQDDPSAGLWQVLKERAHKEPFNLVATIIFVCAIIHTFSASALTRMANRLDREHEKKIARLHPDDVPDNFVCYKAEILHFLGEIEAVFGIWVIPLLSAIFYFYGWDVVRVYLDKEVNYTEPIFVVVIMTIAATRPIIRLAESSLKVIAKVGKCSPAAWWFSILTFGPLLGSFITEPAAMTISALLLARQCYELNPRPILCYATLGLLFVNVSVGGTLTHFAAPPVLMVAGKWGWDIKFMFMNFGLEAFTGILISNTLYYFIFRKDFAALKDKKKEQSSYETPQEKAEKKKRDHPIPPIVYCVHVLFLAWTVFNLHDMPLFIGGFLFFLAFTQVTLHHQFALQIRNPILVGFFLAGLVTHGTLQQWWLQPVLSNLDELSLFIGSTALTAFNDNAAITFLASLVPSFSDNLVLQKAVVMGAVAGGGLTVIANAPNPAGQSILSHYFKDGLSPLKLFLGAITPTIIVSLCFLLMN